MQLDLFPPEFPTGDGDDYWCKPIGRKAAADFLNLTEQELERLQRGHEGLRPAAGGYRRVDLYGRRDGSAC